MDLYYTNDSAIKGISAKHRKMLAGLSQAFSRPFSVKEATELLGIKRKDMRRLLAYWASRGWLSRVRRGIYITVPFDAKNPSERREDPWVIAASLYSPCYIGGWSACEHWDLTEQIFASIVVFTNKQIRKRTDTIQKTSFIFRYIPTSKMFGLKPAWRQNNKVYVSDIERTLVDILNEPKLGGGIRHISEMVHSYFLLKERNENNLLDYIGKINNKTISKRLGYIIEALGINAPRITEFCLKNISAGYSKLDPSIKSDGPLTRRWNLNINASINSKEVQ